MEWWCLTLVKVLIINIILSGDNAIVIAMASRNLPAHQQKSAIFWGGFGAIGLRVVLTLVAVQLLQIPYLTAIGALLLLWVAIKLMIQEEDHQEIKSSDKLYNVVMTIIMADFVMSLDNVVAIAAVAKSDFFLISLGLLFSIPLIIWGSNFILKLIDQFPALIYIGSAILGFTAGEMFVTDKKIGEWMTPLSPFINSMMPILFTLSVFVLGFYYRRKEL